MKYFTHLIFENDSKMDGNWILTDFFLFNLMLNSGKIMMRCGFFWWKGIEVPLT
jgi:hypothetical protein